MKVGILTLPLLNNYGGILQAVAMYNYLEQIGHEPVFLTKKFFRPMHQRVIGNILRSIPGHNIGNIRDHEKQRALHYPFLTEFMPRRSRPLYSIRSISNYVQKNNIDCVIVGSDQVWRPEYISDNESRVFFLDFDGVYRKVSYAASFGSSKWTRAGSADNIRRMLKAFNAVSVRELSGVEYCKSTLERFDCKAAVDPTMLIDKNFYNKFLNNRCSSRGYILNYILDQDPGFLKISELVKAAIGRNYTVRSVSLDNGLETVTIPEWLEAFRHADMIITDSFHGTVFSILFQKQFIAVANIERGVDRFKSLLDQLGLSDRLIYSLNSHDITRLTVEPIEFDRVNAELNKIIQDSRAFIRDALT